MRFGLSPSFLIHLQGSQPAIFSSLLFPAYPCFITYSSPLSSYCRLTLNFDSAPNPFRTRNGIFPNPERNSACAGILGWQMIFDKKTQPCYYSHVFILWCAFFSGITRGISSVGRAPGWQSGCQGFKSLILHSIFFFFRCQLIIFTEKKTEMLNKPLLPEGSEPERTRLFSTPLFCQTRACTNFPLSSVRQESFRTA